MRRVLQVSKMQAVTTFTLVVVEDVWYLNVVGCDKLERLG
jgi:hypothetical protein